MATTQKIKVECINCNGKGCLPHFAHYANGVCFWCSGTGTLLVDADTRDESEQAAIRRAAWAELEATSTYILVDDYCGNYYSNDLADLATVCLERRAQIKNPDYDPTECVYLIHRADGRRVTRGEVAAARIAR